MIVYGSKQCSETLACLRALRESGTPHEFRDIADLMALKEFLHYRDSLPLFDGVKAAGGVGIPFLIHDNRGVYPGVNSSENSRALLYNNIHKMFTPVLALFS